MQCPGCQHDNREGRWSCAECGAPLGVVCTSCGFSNEPGEEVCAGCGTQLGAPAVTASGSRFNSPQSYTPKHLAERILTSKAALEGERKHVTVLFADVKDSMELLADRDPEEAWKILDPVLEHMMEAVHRYEGTVNQVLGDGIMALFGAPLAHEDHAVRACYAALRMQESVKRHAEGVRREHGVMVRIRVGLNSGEVVVRAIDSDSHMDYTAVGQTTHLAARMEQLSAPGSIFLSPATLELTEGYVEVKSLGPLPVKGLREPLEVYELVGAGAARSRLHAAAARGLTRFVGRDSEVDQLRGALERAHAGYGQVVAVVGEPGVGKSRLCWEFTHFQRSRGWLTLEAGSVSYGKAIAYFPFIDLLKAYFHIEARDDTWKIREKVTGKVLALDRDLEPSLSALVSLLEVPVEDEAWGRLDPPQRRQRTLDAVKRLLLRESQVQPLMLLVEDLHWIDAETQALLDSLVESLPTARALLLVNYRSEYQHGWGEKAYYWQLRIDSLPAETADDLLTGLLGTDTSLDALKRTLIDRTEANPLFLEESVRALAETKALTGERGAYRLTQDATAIQVPATVQAILAARIDRLSREDKWLLQAASVIGKDVPFALLLAIAELAEEDLRRGLAHLQAAEFLYETRLFPDLEFAFKHVLTHEVTYRGLLQERRRELHARIVDAIEALHADRLTEHVERLAHHAHRGALGEKAVHYLRQAGLKAAARSGLRDARTYFEQALDVLALLPETQSTLESSFEIRLDLRGVLSLVEEGRLVVDVLREAERIAEKLNDLERRGRVSVFLANAEVLVGELDNAIVRLTSALDIAQRRADLKLRILALGFLAWAHRERGDHEHVVVLTKESLAALPQDWKYDFLGRTVPASVYDRYNLSLSLSALGRFTEAAEYALEGIRIAETLENPNTMTMAYYAAALSHVGRGQWEDGFHWSERALRVSQAGNIVQMLPALLASLAGSLARLGNAREASERVRESERYLDEVAARGSVFLAGSVYGQLGRACLLLSWADEARRLGLRALECSANLAGYAATAHHLLGDVARESDGFDAVSCEEHYRKALSLAEPRGMRPLVAHCHLGLGKLYRRMGNPQEAQERLTIATTMYREMDMQFWLEQAEADRDT